MSSVSALSSNKQPFFKMTAQRAKSEYKEKLITAEAYILYLLDSHRSIGWKWTIEPKSFCKTWEIPRSTFYRAISNLKSKGKLNWEIEGTITLWKGSDIGMQDSLTDEPSNPTDETNSLTNETASLTDETVVLFMDKQGTQTLTEKEIENATDIKQREADSIESDTLPHTPSHEPPTVAPLAGAPTASALEEEKELTTKEIFDWLDRADNGECPPLWIIQQLLDSKYCVNIRGSLIKFEEQWGLTVVNYQVQKMSSD